MTQTILIACQPEPALVERSRTAWPGEVLSNDQMVPHPRFTGHWFGERPDLDESAAGKWQDMLDVTDPEPPPDDSVLWDRDDALISAHSAAVLTSEKATLVDLFIDNLDRWRKREPLRNVYHPDLG